MAPSRVVVWVFILFSPRCVSRNRIFPRCTFRVAFYKSICNNGRERDRLFPRPFFFFIFISRVIFISAGCTVTALTCEEKQNKKVRDLTMFTRRESWAADVLKEAFSRYFFFKVPTGEVCVPSCWWAEWFAIPHVLTPCTCRQHIERSVNKYIDALVVLCVAMATLSPPSFRSNFNSLCAVCVLCTAGASKCQCVGEILPFFYFFFLFAVPPAKTGGHAEQ